MTEPVQGWRVLQLADSAFPSGGFAHSAGLEAALHVAGGLDGGLDGFVTAHLWNAGNSALPFVAAAYDRPDDIWLIDQRLEAQLTNYVANRASRTQGRAFLATCDSIFDARPITVMATRARGREVPAHHAPVFGACLVALGVARADTLRVFLHGSLRGVISAAIRLGLIGPHEGQRLHGRHGPMLDDVLERSGSLRMDQAVTTAPILDIIAATHDRLYARLFQS